VTAVSSEDSLLNLSSWGFFRETLVKFNGTRNAFIHVFFSVNEIFFQSLQEGLPNKCWLLAFTVKSVSKYKKNAVAREFISILRNK
jgi:hypothetical protein